MPRYILLLLIAIAYVNADSMIDLFLQTTSTGFFETTDKSRISTECSTSYSEQLSQNALRMVYAVNLDLLDGQICEPINGLQLNSFDTSISANGNQGSATITANIEAPRNTSFIVMERCASAISAHTSRIDNWDQPIIGGLPGCPNLQFDNLTFEEILKKWSCLTKRRSYQKNGKGRKQAKKHAPGEEYERPRFKVSVNGTLVASGPISEVCKEAYLEQLETKAERRAEDVNLLIDEKLMCIGENRITSVDRELNVDGNTGTVRLDFNLTPQDLSTIDGSEACGHNVSMYVQPHSNWENPIISVGGCPQVIFSTNVFEDFSRDWDCPLS